MKKISANNTTKKMLFIGGVANGKRIEVPYPPLGLWKIPIETDASILFDPMALPVSYYDTYRLEIISCGREGGIQDTVFQVYLYENLKPTDMIRLLIENYRGD